jgi:SAM-dependent MidA family methyltransferase
MCEVTASVTTVRAGESAVPAGGRALPWRQAMSEALYGPGGFYASGAPPAGHFRTSVHASPLFAGAIGTLLRRVDAALGHPDPLDLVDVGAGRAELLAQVAGAAEPGLAVRLRLTAVERAPRPDGLPAGIAWAAEIPDLTGLLVANEWLDNVPLDVVERTAAGPRVVLVAPAGAESVGDPPGAADGAWLARWWPPLGAGERAEVGRARDEAWAAAVRRVRRGLAVAVDYGHRLDGRPPGGTLTGYRAGRAVPPVPDGSCDLTAHVAVDACAAAGRAAGATATLLTTQRDALQQLGVRGRRPPVEQAGTDPAGYLGALAAAGAAAELTDPAGLGAFSWLVHAVGIPLPLTGPAPGTG